MTLKFVLLFISPDWAVLYILNVSGDRLGVETSIGQDGIELFNGHLDALKLVGKRSFITGGKYRESKQTSH